MEASVTDGNLDSDDHHSSDWVFNNLDKDKDGQVSREEFMELAPTILKEALYSSNPEDLKSQTAATPPQNKM